MPVLRLVKGRLRDYIMSPNDSLSHSCESGPRETTCETSLTLDGSSTERWLEVQWAGEGAWDPLSLGGAQGWVCGPDAPAGGR